MELLLRYDFSAFQRHQWLVYVMQLAPVGSVKIGVTKQLESRYRALQSANPFPLHILGTLTPSMHLQQQPNQHDIKRLEHNLHVLWRRWAIHDEWYLPDPVLLQIIADKFTSVPTTIRRVTARWQAVEQIEAGVEIRRSTLLVGTNLRGKE